MDADQPPPLRDKLGTALPVAMTALATVLAGLSTGEMSRAMYWRSAAAQDQAKTNDQWGFAGHKRDRALIVETTAVTLRAFAGVAAPTGRTPSPPDVVERVNRWLQSGTATDAPAQNEAVRRMLETIHARRPELEVVKLAGLLRLKPDGVADDIARGYTDSAMVEAAFDAELEQARQAVRTTDPKAAAAAQAAVYEVDRRRYRAESSMNFWIGYLYEVRVAASTAESDRHRHRSANFFYAMLAAQVGATVSSLALARKHKSTLWLLAGLAGLVAVVFGGYVYLTM